MKSQKPKLSSYYIHNPLAEVTRINISLPFGSAHETEETQGITQFALDLMGRGAKKLDARRISQSLAQYGAAMDFSVGTHCALFQVQVLSEHLEPCLALIERVFTSPTYPKQEFDVLKEEYLSAIRQITESNPGVLFRAHRRFYGARPPLNFMPRGTLASISALTCAAAARWGQARLRVPEARAFVTSNLPEAAVRDVLAACLSWLKFGAIDSPARPELVRRPEALEVAIIHKPESKTNDFIIVQPGLSFAADPKAYYAAMLANEAFGGGMQSRLFQELREKRGWTYGASSGYRGVFYHDYPVPWVVFSFPSVEHTRAAVALTREMLTTYVHDGLSEEEIALYRTHLIRGYPFAVSTPTKLIDKKYDEAVNGRYVMDQEERTRILNEITAADIKAALGRFVSADKFSFLIAGDAEAIRAWLPEALGPIADIRVLKPEAVL